MGKAKAKKTVLKREKAGITEFNIAVHAIFMECKFSYASCSKYHQKEDHN